MKRAIMILTAVWSAAMLIPIEVDAKRLGGGRSSGIQRDSVTQRQATPPPAASPTQPATAPASAVAPKAAPAPATPAVQQPAWKRWMGPIAGIAAGLGIAALMSHLGLSEAFGNFLLLALIVIAAIVLLRLLFRRGKPAEGIQYRGSELAGASPGQSPPPPSMFGGAASGAAAATTVGRSSKPYPDGFDPEPFLRQSKANFIKLQRAYDDADVSTLRDVMTPEMYAQVSKDLASRGIHHATEVVTLNAEILEVVTERDAHWASVRFTGLLREDSRPTPESFDEVWNLTKPLDDETGWLLAGIQQLQ